MPLPVQDQPRSGSHAHVGTSHKRATRTAPASEHRIRIHSTAAARMCGDWPMKYERLKASLGGRVNGTMSSKSSESFFLFLFLLFSLAFVPHAVFLHDVFMGGNRDLIINRNHGAWTSKSTDQKRTDVFVVDSTQSQARVVRQAYAQC